MLHVLGHVTCPGRGSRRCASSRYLAHLISGSLGKGKDRPFDVQFDYFLELANHGGFHANQVMFIFVTLLSPFQTKPGINLKTQTLESGFANEFPFAQYSKKFRFLKSRGFNVQADWEDLKEILSLIQAGGAVLLHGDVSSRSLLVLLLIVLTIVVYGIFRFVRIAPSTSCPNQG